MFHHTLRLSALALACASLGALADTTILRRDQPLAGARRRAPAGNGQEHPCPMQRVTSNLSYLGFRGERPRRRPETVWQVEQDINRTTASGSCGSFASRNSLLA